MFWRKRPTFDEQVQADVNAIVASLGAEVRTPKSLKQLASRTG